MPDTLIRVNVSRAFNAPPLLWKYYDLNISGLDTNPDMKAERAWTYELGMEARIWQRLQAKLSFYRADVRDAISSAYNEATGQYYMKNYEKFRRQGAELQGRFDFTSELFFTACAAFNDIENRITRETVRGAGKARQSYKFGVNYANKNKLKISLEGSYNRWNQPPEALPNDRKMIFDAHIAQSFKNFTCFVNIYNLANSKYWADYYFPIRERYFEGGMTVDW